MNSSYNTNIIQISGKQVKEEEEGGGNGEGGNIVRNMNHKFTSAI